MSVRALPADTGSAEAPALQHGQLCPCQRPSAGTQKLFISMVP